MSVSTVHAVYFSGTGTTEKTVRRIARRLADKLGAAYAEYSYTLPHLRGPRAQSADALPAGHGARRGSAGRPRGAVRQPKL